MPTMGGHIIKVPNIVNNIVGEDDKATCPQATDNPKSENVYKFFHGWLLAFVAFLGVETIG